MIAKQIKSVSQLSNAIQSDYDFTNIARNIAGRENVQNYKLELQYSSNKSDGYTGSVRAAIIRGSNKKLDVVFKYSHRNADTHKALPIRQAFVNEMKFYEEIAPAFAQFQAAHNIERPFDNFAGYYGCVDQVHDECLAMENIKCSNFDLWDRTQLMNPAHLELALATFAKLHGTSMAMKKLNPKLYTKISTGIEIVLTDFIQEPSYYSQVSDVAAMLDGTFDPVTEKVYADKLAHYRTHVKEISDAVFEFHDEHDVILQGDCWSNNAMYQYEDMNNRSVPKNMKLLDWQCILIGPVTMDLSYFFYTIAPKECYDNLEHYMKVYHDVLSDHLKSFGLDVDEVFPYKVFEKQWQKVSLFGFLQSFPLRKMMYMKSEDAPDIGDGFDVFIANMRIQDGKMEIFKQQIKEIVLHFVDRKIL